MSASAVSIALQRLLEILSIICLSLACHEQFPLVFTLPLFLLVGIIFHRKIGESLGFLFIGIVFVFSGSLVFGGLLQIGAVSGLAIVCTHTLMYMLQNQKLYSVWRIALTFLEVVLAGTLYPELSLFILIFVYFILLANVLTTLFINLSCEKLNVPLNLVPMGKKFFVLLALLSAGLIALSMVIFPILPSVNWTPEINIGSVVDYVESVNYKNPINSWMDGDKRTLMVLMSEDGKPFKIPYGLVRGKVLDQFDGVEWVSARKKFVDAPINREISRVVSVVREKLNSDILPIPYGSLVINENEPKYTSNNEYLKDDPREKTIKYKISIGNFTAFNFSQKPLKANLNVPDGFEFEKLRDLLNTSQVMAKSENQKVQWIRSFFAKDFTYSTTRQDAAVKNSEHPIIKFLMQTRSGHCEAYATATAILLRMVGIPSRLVVGFRTMPVAGQGVAIIKNNSAHAWVEYYTNDGGWQPLDTTPASGQLDINFEWLSNLADEANILWQKYVLSYQFEFSLEKIWKYLASIVGVIFIFSFARVIYNKRIGVKEWYRGFFNYRIKATKLFLRESRKRKLSVELNDLYLKLRFGRDIPSKMDYLKFKKLLMS